MSASPHNVFTPPSGDAILWRYMDLTKFLALLERAAVYFARADLLGDPFEGSFPTRNTQRRIERWGEYTSYLPKGSAPPAADDTLHNRRAMVKEMYVSCWHMNPYESAGMWNLYTRTPESVAIRTTFAALDAQIQPIGHQPVYAGVVHYVDFETDFIDESNGFWPFVHKRFAFEHEREMRLCFWGAGRREGHASPREPGKWMPVDLAALIQRVYVHPSAAGWFRELVSALLARYGLQFEVAHSAIAGAPGY
jgi:hypothetical protein